MVDSLEKELADIREDIRTAWVYMELVGGLGDAILRMYFSGGQWYKRLETMPPQARAVVALMCHNPYLAEVFQWHPRAAGIRVLDLGFTTSFHPWENADWRVAHGLPSAAPCPPHAPADTLAFYPSPEDRTVLDELSASPRYLVMAATTGKPDKNIPQWTKEWIAKKAVEMGYRVLVVGRSRYLKQDGREREIEAADGVIDATDRLSVPGMIEAVKLAHGVVSADTSVLHAAWHEHRPVFLLYNKHCLENYVSRGPVGYMQGINRPDTDHMLFSKFTPDRFVRWLEGRG